MLFVVISGALIAPEQPLVDGMKQGKGSERSDLQRFQDDSRVRDGKDPGFEKAAVKNEAGQGNRARDVERGDRRRNERRERDLQTIRKHLPDALSKLVRDGV